MRRGEGWLAAHPERELIVAALPQAAGAGSYCPGARAARRGGAAGRGAATTPNARSSWRSASRCATSGSAAVAVGAQGARAPGACSTSAAAPARCLTRLLREPATSGSSAWTCPSARCEQAARRLRARRAARRAARADRAPPGPADLPRPAPGGLRRRGARGGDRASRSAAAGGVRAERVRVRAAGDRGRHDARTPSTTCAGRRCRPATSGTPTIALSGRARSSPTWGGRRGRPLRLRRPLPAGRRRGPGGRGADADGGVQPMRIDRSPDPSLVVLIGASGSGKSSFAREHFLADRGDLLGLLPRAGRRRRERPGARPPTRSRCCTSSPARRLAQPRLTVVDATNVQREARRPLIELAQQHDLFPGRDRARPAGGGLPGAQPRRGPTATSGRTSCASSARSCASRSRGLQREGFRRVHVLRSPEEVDGGRGPARAALDRPAGRARPVRHHRRRPRLPRRARRAAARARLRGRRRRRDCDAASRATRGLRRRLRRPRPATLRACCGW